MRDQKDAPGIWGSMRTIDGVTTATEQFPLYDGSSLFVRSWRTASPDILLILHGLGGHSGWYVDMGNELAAAGLTVYAVDHRGFGRSDGLEGHIDNYRTYVKDSVHLIEEIRRRHPQGRIHVLGHSMGGIFTAYLAADYGHLLAGAIFLNPWIADSARIPLGKTLAILSTGLLRSRRPWQVGNGHEGMTTNPEAIQMLENDPFWRRAQTANFLVQILFMRLGVLKTAPRITIPTLVLQAEEDRSVIAAATRTFYERLGSQDKTWTTYARYNHDSQFEADRSQLDADIIAWIRKHAGQFDGQG